MTDYFAVLGEPRRPWLDPERLKRKFLGLSAEAHPDRSHNASAQEKQAAQDRYTELNAAYQCLKEPKERLRHLLELRRGIKPGQIQRIPSELMNFSITIGQACREADGVLQEKAGTTSPLLQVAVFERAQQTSDKLAVHHRELESQRETLLREIQSLDAIWSGVEAGPPSDGLVRLEQVYALLSYFERWNAQVRERIVQLSL